ncbi:hypothetical protein BT96DRAFT_937328 [Gymnopus androsaceus JB14]|uniref:Uncharacterized protein n=1 Tax=Gymnopus androsaceus JB14 TaxID=1447944 RepID=A0A6A4HUN6_9AGAR|nr:hypothetical protein BT96DRAFT_937328 [Gymnopus androsaceus JB14]
MSYFTSPSSESSFDSSGIFTSTSTPSYATPLRLFIPAAQSPREVHETYEQLNLSFGFGSSSNRGILRPINDQKKIASGLRLKKLWKSTYILVLVPSLGHHLTLRESEGCILDPHVSELRQLCIVLRLTQSHSRSDSPSFRYRPLDLDEIAGKTAGKSLTMLFQLPT